MPRYLSDEDLEAIATRVLRAYCRLPEVQNTELLYIDPSLLATDVLGLKIEYLNLSNDEETLGLTCFEDVGVEIPGIESGWYQFDGKTILIEKSLQENDEQYGRRNFTITHEAGHHILKMLYPGDYAHGVNARRILHYREGSPTSCPREEWQVNKLSSAILMPEFLIRQGMKIVGLDGRIEVLNKLWRRDKYDKFCDLAYLLGVSKQALCIRMKHFNLIGREYLRNPRAMMDVVFEEDDLYD